MIICFCARKFKWFIRLVGEMATDKEKALEILDAIELENNAYKEIFEHTYGEALGLN